MSQLPLPLLWPQEEGGERFILSESNAAAARHLERWSVWSLPITVLHGPRKSGRSTLGRLFVGKTKGILIDDAWAADEEALFHAWNDASASRRPLLIVADAPPPAWRIALPDLASRLAASPSVGILDPDPPLIAALFEAQLARRGLSVSPQLIDWLQPRIERTHLAVLRAVDALDRAALSRQRGGLTIPFAREVLAEAGVIDAS
ncbi:MAG: chromosomal replication initiator DnaA [Sphingomonadaceae bacterium]|nr:chromosomal replication initiator DnaA [Sphingomonadaceae bacterium]